MKKIKSIAASAMALAMMASLAGCGSTTPATPASNNGGDKGGDTTTAAAANNDAGSNETAAPAASSDGTIKEFTAFFAVPGNEINSDNRVQNVIAEKIGAKCKETWLTGQTAEEAIGVMIAGGEYTDFIVGSSGSTTLIDAGALIPIDEYWDNYPNLKGFYSDAEWNQIRNEDGHVYIIPQFGNVYMYDTGTIHNDEAFWIQTRVLKWAGYPKIETLDEYFDVIERYIEANPTMEDGTPNIGYEILSDDWRYFCLENAPFFLDGYPNDGCCIVDPETHQAIDYNTTPTAKRYFQKLNEEYAKGIIDPETFTLNYDQYIAKISSGRVCGMVDQHWDFQTGELAIQQQGLDDNTYVPVGVVIDKGIKERYHSESALDATGGIGITTSCKDVEGALKFIDDLLSPEILTLRNWGQEGIDYLVDENGLYYRDETMRKNAVDQAYLNANMCSYSYFPNYEGMDHDGINACNANNQPSEFYEALPEPVKECFNAYGVQTYVQLLNASQPNSDWFPMWSYSNAFTTETPWGLAKVNMDEVKHEYLPKVVIAGDFESAWEEYLAVYNDRCDIATYLDALTKEVQRRIDVAQGN